MPEEGFLRRWARLKATGGEAEAAEAPAPVPVTQPGACAGAAPQAAPAQEAPLPTLEDAARLTPDADFSAFVARGVDKSVQRLALKKLFADPHFNAIDGLDIYMNDYNNAAPLTPAMLASLKHAPSVLSRLFGDEPDGAPATTAPDQRRQALPEAVPEAQPEALPEAQPKVQPKAQPDAQPKAQPGARLAPQSTPQGNA